MIRIRPAQPSDKTAILAFCQHTWETESDYIPAVWDQWFADPSGHILVATLDGQPVGMSRVVQLSESEGWWEGLRVDRSYRRQGVGHQLTNAALEKSRSLGLNTLGTCVNVTNTPMHPFVLHRGFIPQGDYAIYSHKAIASVPTALQLLSAEDSDRIWAALTYFAPEEGDRLFVVSGAKWQTLTPTILLQRLEQGWVWGITSGDALVSLFIRSQMDNPDGTLWIGWLGGTPIGIQTALQDMRGLARQLRFEAIGGFLPQRQPLRQLLNTMDYQFSETHVYRLYAQDCQGNSSFGKA